MKIKTETEDLKIKTELNCLKKSCISCECLGGKNQYILENNFISNRLMSQLTKHNPLRWLL